MFPSDESCKREFYDTVSNERKNYGGSKVVGQRWISVVSRSSRYEQKFVGIQKSPTQSGQTMIFDQLQ